MWWGAAMESSEPAALAAFYSKLLDWPVVLAAAVADAQRLGAELADTQPQANVRVMFDPDGRPFCPCQDSD